MAVVKMSDCEVRENLNAFVNGPIGEWDWDDFISVPIKDPYLNAIRIICRDLPTRFPPEPGTGAYCNSEGWEVLKLIGTRMLPTP
jgi:hypothetical protein